IRVFQMLLESEKVLVQERTSNGLKAAREKGRKGGRPQKVEKSQRYYIKQLYDSDKYTGEEIAQMTGLSRSSIYRIIKEMLSKKSRIPLYNCLPALRHVKHKICAI